MMKGLTGPDSSRRRGSRFAAVGALVVIVGLSVAYVSGALATNPSGVTTATFGVARFDNIDTTTKTDLDSGVATNFWQARLKSGTATVYMKDDPTCSPDVVQAGSGFVDNGHDTHVVRNEGSVDLVTVVVSIVPAGFARRIDEPAPANCPNLPNG